MRTGKRKTRSKTIVPDNKETEPDDMMNSRIWIDTRSNLQRILLTELSVSTASRKELAKLPGTTKQFISNLENDRKPISRIMAKKLSEIFNLPDSRFI